MRIPYRPSSASSNSNVPTFGPRRRMPSEASSPTSIAMQSDSSAGGGTWNASRAY